METPSVKTADFENLRAATRYRLNNLLNSVPITRKANVPNFEVEELQRATEGARRNGDEDWLLGHINMGDSRSPCIGI
jgi:hypothetical protein